MAINSDSKNKVEETQSKTPAIEKPKRYNSERRTRFNERGRIEVSDTVEIVVSEVIDEKNFVKGFSINKYISAENFTGFSKGVYIPEDMLNEFLKVFDKEDLELALSQK